MPSCRGTRESGKVDLPSSSFFSSEEVGSVGLTSSVEVVVPGGGEGVVEDFFAFFEPFFLVEGGGGEMDEL